MPDKRPYWYVIYYKESELLDFIIDLLKFSVQATIIVVGILVVVGFIFSLMNRSKDQQLIKIKNINKQFQSYRSAMNKNLLDKKDWKKQQKIEKKKKDSKKKPKLFVLSFEGDIKASAVDQFREEVTAILTTATSEDEVVIKLESPGGMVHAYGLASSQVQRIKDRKIPLTVCVDKVAASGGYMMASVADRIVAAPFAIIGSIGVIASMPNFSKILKKNDLDYLEITAGEYKRTLTPMGEVTEQGMKKFKEQIEDIHLLFKDHVAHKRPQVDISKVATGEYWFGTRAKELELVDRISTSDDYIHSLNDSHCIYEVSFQGKKSFKEKLAESLSFLAEHAYTRLWTKLWASNTEL